MPTLGMAKAGIRQRTQAMASKQEFRGLKGLKKQRRIQIVALAAVALMSAVAVIWLFVPKEAINFFRSPTEVLASPPAADEVFRIGGLVVEGSIERGVGTEVAFEVTDTNATVPVRYTGVLPDLFAEGQGMVALGRMEGGVFVATEVLAKHDETYMPKEVVDALKEQGVYQEPES
jgi:cytochrome c-type biogenesis protein CcmE